MSNQDLLNVMYIDLKRRIVESAETDTYKGIQKISDLYVTYLEVQERLTRYAILCNEKIIKPDDLHSFITSVLNGKQRTIFTYSLISESFSIKDHYMNIINIILDKENPNIELLLYILEKNKLDINIALDYEDIKGFVSSVQEQYTLLDFASYIDNQSVRKILKNHGAENDKNFIKVEE